MPDTSSPSRGGGQSGNRNRSRNRNRNRNRDRNRSGGDGSPNKRNKRSGGQSRNRNDDEQDQRGAGHRTGGYTREKVPRRAPRPTLWKRVLGIFGLGDDKPSAKSATAKATAKATGASPQKEAGTTSGGRASKPRQTRAKGRGDAPARQKRASRAPEQVEVSGPRLYVGNLSYDTTEEDLQELFSGVGGVESAEVVTQKNTQRSKGFAFVVLRSTEEAKRAVEVLHDKDFMGRKITVSGAKSSGPATGS
jgi:hypothetical protein